MNSATEQLKQLANQWTSEDGVTFFMFPYFPLRFSVVTDELRRLFGKEKDDNTWENSASIFILCEPTTIDIEFPAELKPSLRALQAYWSNRNGSTEHNWELFQQVMSADAVNLWYDAHANTRDDLLAAPDGMTISGEPDADPNASSSDSD